MATNADALLCQLYIYIYTLMYLITCLDIYIFYSLWSSPVSRTLHPCYDRQEISLKISLQVSSIPPKPAKSNKLQSSAWCWGASGNDLASGACEWCYKRPELVRVVDPSKSYSANARALFHTLCRGLCRSLCTIGDSVRVTKTFRRCRLAWLEMDSYYFTSLHFTTSETHGQ